MSTDLPPALTDPAIGRRKAYVVIQVTEADISRNIYEHRPYRAEDEVAVLSGEELRALGLWDRARDWEREHQPPAPPRRRWVDPKVGVTVGGITFGLRDATPEEVEQVERRLNKDEPT